jgi:integrase
MAAKLETTNTPGIYRCGNRYVVVWKHRGRQHKSFHRTMAEAREAKGHRQAGDRRPVTRQGFEEFALAWVDTYTGRTKRGIGDGTLHSYRRCLELYAIPFFAGYRLSDVEPADVRRFVQHLEQQGLRPGTRRAIVAPLRAMFATAWEDGDLVRNPAATVRVTGSQADRAGREVRALTRVELGRLLHEVPTDWRLLFELLAHTGLPIGEAVGLEWGDVEFGNTPRLKVRRQDRRGTVAALKTERSRRDIPLSPGMARRLWTARATSDPTGRVFTSRRGQPLSDGNVRYRVLDPAAERAGMGWVTFHTFRHTCASLLFEAGRDVKQVQEWLGHADPGFTLRTYIHLMDDGIGDAAFLDGVVKVGNPGATLHPETAATGELPAAADSAA